ncbi:hypothetical protein QQG74_09945 [Micromonospora sp. FIMYZ51]|uniref:hypothetical protein n=1 Tax=Micromonospora sp. FIMYZ51 TaxID=3051832 RepID=UPI00311E440C
MSEPNSPSYVALVAALRSEFNPLALEAMKIQLAEHRNHRSSVGTLVQAITDAGDVSYDAGESVHPAVRAFLYRALRTSGGA